MLNSDNYKKGFLIDEDWMAGVAEEKTETSNLLKFKAFIIDHPTGSFIYHQVFDDLSGAIDSINAIQRTWQYESTSGCGSGKCGGGNCKGGGCGKKKTESSETTAPDPQSLNPTDAAATEASNCCPV